MWLETPHQREQSYSYSESKQNFLILFTSFTFNALKSLANTCKMHLFTEVPPVASILDSPLSKKPMSPWRHFIKKQQSQKTVYQ